MSLIERAIQKMGPEPERAATPAPSTTVVADVPKIDFATRQGPRMISTDGARTRLSEEFRAIKRTLIDNAFRQRGAPLANGPRIMVTSSLPGEGKTFTAVNLALSIALERDHTVLLVDADVAKPGGGGFLGTAGGMGLLDLLVDDRLRLEELAVRTSLEKLDVLLAGRPHPHATELLASANMGRLLDEIATLHPDRVVIFDAPPLLLTTEASALAARMGQIVLVVEASRTTQATVGEALAQLGRREHVFGLLNKSSGAPAESPFTYGGYGNYDVRA